MPKIGNVFIDHIKTEGAEEGIEVSEHPIESNKEIVDHIEVKPLVLTLPGVLVGKDAYTRLEKLRKYMHKGELVDYTYRSIYKNMLIVDIPQERVKEIENGFSFSITLKRIRIAKVGTVNKGQPQNANAVTNKGRQQATGATTTIYTVKSGDVLSVIAAKYKVSTTKLYEKNRGVIGKNPNMIRPGQKLVIPK